MILIRKAVGVRVVEEVGCKLVGGVRKSSINRVLELRLVGVTLLVAIGVQRMTRTGVAEMREDQIDRGMTEKAKV